MSSNGRKREVFANPFFVVMMAASVIFVFTVLAYLVSPSVLEPGGADVRNDSSDLKVPAAAHSAGSLALAAWVDRNAPWVLAAEFAIMLVSGVVAMLTDPWFTPRSKPKPPA